MTKFTYQTKNILLQVRANDRINNNGTCIDDSTLCGSCMDAPFLSNRELSAQATLVCQRYHCTTLLSRNDRIDKRSRSSALLSTTLLLRNDLVDKQS